MYSSSSARPTCGQEAFSQSRRTASCLACVFLIPRGQGRAIPSSGVLYGGGDRGRGFQGSGETASRHRAFYNPLVRRSLRCCDTNRKRCGNIGRRHETISQLCVFFFNFHVTTATQPGNTPSRKNVKSIHIFPKCSLYFCTGGVYQL